MPTLDDDFLNYPRRVKPLIYVFEASQGIPQHYIATLNAAMNVATNALADCDRESADAAIKIGVLSHNDSFTWMYPELESAEHFRWKDYVTTGEAHLGIALLELNKKLSRRAMLSFSTGSYAPVIIFVGCNNPADDLWRKSLSELQRNNWYRNAVKIAILLDSITDSAVYEEIVGDPDAVMAVPNIEDFERVVVTTSLSAVFTYPRGTEEEGKMGAVVAQNVRNCLPEIFPMLATSGGWDEWDEW